MPDKAQPNYSYTALDGSVLALSESRFDERQRRQRHRLQKGAVCWDYAPLLDVVRRERGFRNHRFTGKSAAEWVADLRRRKSPELDRFTHWYESLVGHFLGELAKRSRIPENLYSIEVARPPLTSSLPSLIRGLGLKRASAEQWAATLRAMTSKGVKPEELDESGVLIRLETQFAGETLSQAQVVRLIDLRHVTPKFVCESSFGFMTKAGWNECCQWVPAKDYKKRGLWGSKGDGSWYVIRYRHRALGWSVVRCRYTDLFTRRPDWWWVLDERGKLIAQPPEGFDSPEDAIEYAEHKINQRFSSMGRDHALSKWERYSLPGNDGYREILIQLDDWPGSYKPRHYRTRNVLVHIRTGVRETDDGRQVLFLDEIQSDWHADLHAASKDDSARQNKVPPPDAPFRKDWPLLALKLMLWWSQVQKLDGVAWSTAELQSARWRSFGPPEALYRSALPDAARSIARVLSLELAQTSMAVRSNTRWVELADDGWVVRNRSGVPITKPFRHRGQAEVFADLTGSFVRVNVPVLWLNDVPPIKAIPLYGAATEDFWLQSDSRSARLEG